MSYTEDRASVCELSVLYKDMGKALHRIQMAAESDNLNQPVDQTLVEKNMEHYAN